MAVLYTMPNYADNTAIIFDSNNVESIIIHKTSQMGLIDIIINKEQHITMWSI